MTWWIWVVAGIVLMVSEFVIPGFVVCFFGAGAILAGLTLFVFPCLGLTWQILLFVLASVVFTLIGRKIFLGGRSEDPDDVDRDDFTGATATVVESISPDRPGKVEFRGSFWTAVSDRELAAGAVVRIVRRGNLTLTVSDKQL